MVIQFENISNLDDINDINSLEYWDFKIKSCLL